MPLIFCSMELHRAPRPQILIWAEGFWICDRTSKTQDNAKLGKLFPCSDHVNGQHVRAGFTHQLLGCWQNPGLPLKCSRGWRCWANPWCNKISHSASLVYTDPLHMMGTALTPLQNAWAAWHENPLMLSFPYLNKNTWNKTLNMVNLWMYHWIHGLVQLTSNKEFWQEGWDWYEYWKKHFCFSNRSNRPALRNLEFPQSTDHMWLRKNSPGGLHCPRQMFNKHFKSSWLWLFTQTQLNIFQTARLLARICAPLCWNASCAEV